MNKIRGVEWDLLPEFKSKTKTTKYGQDRDDAVIRNQNNALTIYQRRRSKHRETELVKMDEDHKVVQFELRRN